MTLSQLLRRENNNADLLRLIAALAVIWGHAYRLVLEPGVVEPIEKMLGFDYSGSLAVKFFFFLSGILVTYSWISKPSALRFVSARLFRIFPLLIVTALFAVFVMGPILTALPIHDYFAHRAELATVLRHPYNEYLLPGVFASARYPHANGSIWTIKYELTFYALLLGAGLCGFFRTKWTASAILAAVIVMSFVRPENITLIGLSNVNQAGNLPAFFAFGSLLAIHRDAIRIDFRLCAGLVLLALAVRHGPAFQYVFYPAFLIASLWFMSLDFVKAIRLPGDFSYGVYVFGWPLQNTFANYFHKGGIAGNQVMTASCALLLAATSWYLLEKPCISIGHRIPDLIRGVIRRRQTKRHEMHSPN